MKERPIIFHSQFIPQILDGTKTQTRRVVKNCEFYKDWNHAERLTKESHGGIFRGAENGDWLLQKEKGPIEDLSYQPIGSKYGRPGDRLWVRETLFNDGDQDWMFFDGVYVDIDFYPEDWEKRNCSRGIIPSIHMPRWASRITLEITDIRAERVQEISVEDARKEGYPKHIGVPGERVVYPKEWFIRIWNSIYAKPRPVIKKGEIIYYVSYPWEDIQEEREHKGKKWIVVGNPWVFVHDFERIEA